MVATTKVATTGILKVHVLVNPFNCTSRRSVACAASLLIPT